MKFAKSCFHIPPLQAARHWRKGIARLCAVLALSGAAGLSQAAYNVWTSEYTVSKQELQSAIAPQFPRKMRYMDIFDVTLSNPRLAMDEARNRLTTVVDAQIDNKLILQRPINSVLTLSSAFRYDAPTRSVRLDSPAVEKVEVADVPPQYGQQLNTLANQAAQQFLKDYTIYTFQPEQLQMNGKRFEPGKITVQKDGVKVEIKEM